MSKKHDGIVDPMAIIRANQPKSDSISSAVVLLQYKRKNLLLPRRKGVGGVTHTQNLAGNLSVIPEQRDMKLHSLVPIGSGGKVMGQLIDNGQHTSIA